MATGKKSFILYADYGNIFSELTNEEAGRLIKHLFKYVNDENPVMENRLLKIVFEPIKMQLKRDLKDWEKTIEGRSDGGRLGNLKRWNNDLYLQVDRGKMTLDEAEIIAKDRKASVSDTGDRSVSLPIANVAVNVTDTVTDTVNENDINIVEEVIENFRQNFFSHSLHRSLIEKEKIPAEKIPELMEVFLDQKNGFKELNGKGFQDLCKNFYYWIPKYLSVQKTKEKNSGQKESNGLPEKGIARIIAVGEQVINPFKNEHREL